MADDCPERVKALERIVDEWTVFLLRYHLWKIERVGAPCG